MDSVVIFGAGSPIIVDVEETCRRNGIDIVAVIKNFDGPVFSSYPEKLLDVDDVLPDLLKNPLIIPLFTPAYRKSALDQAVALGASTFPGVIDRTAFPPSTLSVGHGVYVNCGATIGGFAKLLDFCFVNRSASLGHHVEVGEFASVGPGVVTGGNVKIGRGAVVATGAVILPGVTVGSNAVVGAGAVVTHDVPDNTLVFGNPARVVKHAIAGYHDKGV